jgi:hypothetical protein
VMAIAIPDRPRAIAQTVSSVPPQPDLVRG